MRGPGGVLHTVDAGEGFQSPIILRRFCKARWLLEEVGRGRWGRFLGE